MQRSKANLSSMDWATGWTCCIYCRWLDQHYNLPVKWKKNRKYSQWNNILPAGKWQVELTWVGQSLYNHPPDKIIGSSRKLDEVYATLRAMKFLDIWDNTWGKPLPNKPRPTRQTSGVMTTGLKNLQTRRMTCHSFNRRSNKTVKHNRKTEDHLKVPNQN